MPIRRALRRLYPANWREISHHVRFVVADGRCQRCARPHKTMLRCLPDGRWFDEESKTWRDRRGRQAVWPNLVDATALRWTRVVIAAAHLDGNPRHNSRTRNLRALCQRCHLMHDRRQHARQRWITWRRRYAVGDLFLGRYEDLVLEAVRDAAATPAPLSRPAPYVLRVSSSIRLRSNAATSALPFS